MTAPRDWYATLYHWCDGPIGQHMDVCYSPRFACAEDAYRYALGWKNECIWIVTHGEPGPKLIKVIPWQVSDV